MSVEARTGRPRCSASTGAPRPPCAAFDPRWHVRLTFARDGAIVIQCAEDPSGRWHIGTTAWPGKPRLLSQFPAAPQWKNERNGVVFQRQRAQSSAELPERLLSKCARPYCKGLRNRIPPGAPVHKLADSGRCGGGAQTAPGRACDADGRTKCLARSSHPLGQLRRPQYRALGAVHALESSEQCRGRGQIVNFRGASGGVSTTMISDWRAC